MNMVKFMSEIISITRHGEESLLTYSALFYAVSATETARDVATNLAIGMCPFSPQQAKIEVVVEPLAKGDHLHVMLSYQPQENAFERLAAFMQDEIK